MAETVYERYAAAFRAWQDAFGFKAPPRLRDERESKLLEDLRDAWQTMTLGEQTRAELLVDVPALRLGVYIHHSGGEYTVTGLIWHHDVQRPMVKYVSHKLGKENARELRSWPGHPDGWNEPVRKDGVWVPRFRLMVVHPAMPAEET